MNTHTQEELNEIVRLHGLWRIGDPAGVKANLTDADLRGAYLTRASLTRASLTGANLAGANLTDADLRGAYLTGANLTGANLTGANLTRASLTDADLRGAYLTGANLTRASLTRASLTGANLARVNLDGARLPTGDRWEQYVGSIVPNLCTAGGKSLAEIAESWDCHQWANCPMHLAFDFDGNYENASPLVVLLRPRIEQFVQLFDAGLVPRPVVEDQEVTQ